LRQWADVDFVPGEKDERKESQPLRYVGLRLLKPQGVRFHDGTDRRFHAVVTNQKIEGGRLLDWHREKAGTVEHTHDEVKNKLGGGHVPSQRFGVNSVWFKISLLTYNLVNAIKGLCLEGEERTARMKRFRLLLIHVADLPHRRWSIPGDDREQPSSVRQAFCSADFLWPESHRRLRFFLLRLSSSICDTAVTRL
jgi:hypothetical protein